MVFDNITRDTSRADGAMDTKDLLAKKNPAAAKLVEDIKATAAIRSGDRMQRIDPPTHYVPSGNPSRLMTKGEMRLAQAYLRVMDYFGPMADVTGIDVVHGYHDARTRKAIRAFTEDHGNAYFLSSPAPTIRLLKAIIEEHDVFFQRKMQPIDSVNSQHIVLQSIAQTQREQLDRAFESQKTLFGHYYGKIKTLHPEIRFPLLTALTDLKQRYGIEVVMYEAYRTPDKQTGHVMKGESTAPPGYSFHGNGLAIDLYPADSKGNAIKNKHDPKWQKLYDVMQTHHFYSMMLKQGWDAPHHELTATTSAMLTWHQGPDQWKDIPTTILPAEWALINQKALSTPSSGHDSGIPAWIKAPSQRIK